MKKTVKGSIYYVDLEKIKESKEKRFLPVLIIYDKDNKVMIAPLDVESDYPNEKTCVEIKRIKTIRPKTKAFLDQLMIIDKKNLKGFVGIINDDEFDEIEKTLINLFQLYTKK